MIRFKWPLVRIWHTKTRKIRRVCRFLQTVTEQYSCLNWGWTAHILYSKITMFGIYIDKFLFQSSIAYLVFLPIKTKQAWNHRNNTNNIYSTTLTLPKVFGVTPFQNWAIRQSGRLIVAWRRRRVAAKALESGAVPCLPRKKWWPRTQMSMAWKAIDGRFDTCMCVYIHIYMYVCMYVCIYKFSSIIISL